MHNVSRKVFCLKLNLCYSDINTAKAFLYQNGKYVPIETQRVPSSHLHDNITQLIVMPSGS